MAESADETRPAAPRPALPRLLQDDSSTALLGDSHATEAVAVSEGDSCVDCSCGAATDSDGAGGAAHSPVLLPDDEIKRFIAYARAHWTPEAMADESLAALWDDHFSRIGLSLAQNQLLAVQILIDAFNDWGPASFLDVSEALLDMHIRGNALFFAFEAADRDLATLKASLLRKERKFLRAINESIKKQALFSGPQPLIPIPEEFPSLPFPKQRRPGLNESSNSGRGRSHRSTVDGAPSAPQLIASAQDSAVQVSSWTGAFKSLSLQVVLVFLSILFILWLA